MSAIVSNIVSFDRGAMLRAALAYASMGWHVLPCWGTVHTDDGKPGRCGCGHADCPSPGKHPHGILARTGQMAATTDPDTIRRWFASGHELNIGIQLSQSRLAAIDVDPRNGGALSLENLEAKYGPLSSGVEQISGGGGQHFVYSNPHGVHGLPGKLGPGLDVKANGYIIVWPSRHWTGGLYEWEASSDPTEGCVPSPLPDWMRDLAGGRHQDAPEWRGSRYVTEEQIEDLRAALACLPADDYHQWINFGQALKAAGGAGFELWDSWSQTSSKYHGPVMGPKWRSFRPGAYQIESIFHAAMHAGWTNPRATAPETEPVPVAAITPFVQPEAPSASQAPANLPGVLGIVEDWINATSRKPQPAFAAQAALAFCSTVLGRRVMSDQRNWPSLYFLNIGKSASGKEHAKWAIEQLLDACCLSQLIGPAGYTSDSGVLSTLAKQPSHIAIIDEFGKTLEAASIKHGARAASAMKALMEAWGRCDGVMRPQGFSTFGMSAADEQRIDEKTVRNPALTLLGMTTPESFFESIGSAAARDGFLNRFLIVESDIGRQAGRTVNPVEIPEQIITWARQIADANPLAGGSPMAAPRIVPFSPASSRLFKAFEQECINLMDAHDDDGMAEMFGRTTEIAMRIALVAACACDADQIEAEHAQCAIDYARQHAVRIVDRLATAVADSEFQGLQNQVLDVLRAAGPKGLTEREINHYSRKFRAVDKRAKINVLDTLAYTGDAARCEFPPASGRGKPRLAWVAVQDNNGDNGDKT